MAGNEWINGYLEAILDAGTKQPLLHRDRRFSFSALTQLVGELHDEGSGRGAKAVAAGERYSTTKYFVEEVVSRFDDTDLHKTWVKVQTEYNTIFVSLFAFNSNRLADQHNNRWWPQGIAKRGTVGWRTCAGGYGIWREKRNG